jgi:hypothetical protein
MIVDVHAHLWPRAWEADSAMRGGEAFDPVAMHEARRAANIDATIFSNPHMWSGAPMDMGAVEHARTYDDFAAKVQREYSGELFGLASITPWRGEEQLVELERATFARTHRSAAGDRRYSSSLMTFSIQPSSDISERRTSPG